MIFRYYQIGFSSFLMQCTLSKLFANWVVHTLWISRERVLPKMDYFLKGKRGVLDIL